ncbi:MAG: hypothetical protein LBD55_08775 [Treponema sp.]|nr:hypothetical protein [Treponema sp.]
MKADTGNHVQALQTTGGDQAAEEDIRLKNTLHTAPASRFNERRNPLKPSGA